MDVSSRSTEGNPSRSTSGSTDFVRKKVTRSKSEGFRDPVRSTKQPNARDNQRRRGRRTRAADVAVRRTSNSPVPMRSSGKRLSSGDLSIMSDSTSPTVSTSCSDSFFALPEDDYDVMDSLEQELLYKKKNKSKPPKKDDEAQQKPAQKEEDDETNPEVYLRQLLQGRAEATYQSQTWEESFEKQAVDKNRKPHSPVMLKAIRTGDVEKLEVLHQEGVCFQQSNPEGESLLQVACRSNQVSVLKYFLQEIGLNIRVKDAVGRTPLHDACWTGAPNLEVVDCLVKEAPELLFVADARGFTPLKYVPKPFWSEFREYFDANHSSWNLAIPEKKAEEGNSTSQSEQRAVATESAEATTEDDPFKKTQDRLREIEERMQALKQKASSVAAGMD